MIIHRVIEDLYCPIIVCDACGRTITGIDNVYWLVLDDCSLHPNLWHTHKYECAQLDRAIERQLGGLVMSQELDVWLRQLHANFTAPLTNNQQRSKTP